MPAQLKRRLFIFLALLALDVASLFGHWWLVGRHLESTDNAYVQGEITRVSSQLGARIEQVLMQDNQHVEQGELLLVLESADFQLAKQRAEATLATREAELSQARSTLDQQASLIAASQADVSASQATLGRTQIDLSRAQTLRKPGFVSEERVTTLAADNRVARSQVAKAQADLQAPRQQVASLEAELKRLDALILAAQADLEQADLNLSGTQIHAPISGMVGQRSAREGQVVQSGAYLLSLVPDQDIWIQANFKETQIGRMRPGQKAELLFDSYPDTPIDRRPHRQPVRRLRRAIQSAAARQHHRQLHQGGAAHPGQADLRRRQPAAWTDPPRHVGGGQRGPAQRRQPWRVMR